MANKDQLLALLSRHIGEANGITAEQIAAALDIPKRQVRTLVSELRLDRKALCGHPRDGYYIAATQEEVIKTSRFLTGRALKSLLLASRLSGEPLEDLVGQMRLPT